MSQERKTKISETIPVINEWWKNEWWTITLKSLRKTSQIGKLHQQSICKVGKHLAQMAFYKNHLRLTFIFTSISVWRVFYLKCTSNWLRVLKISFSSDFLKLLYNLKLYIIFSDPRINSHGSKQNSIFDAHSKIVGQTIYPTPLISLFGVISSPPEKK